MSNVICSIVFGERFDYNNHIFKKIVQAMYEIGKLTGSPMLVMIQIFPRLATFLQTYRKIVWKINEVKEFVLERIKHQRQELNSNAISGYIDAYLMKQEQELAKAKTFFDDENLVTTVVDLFAAGINTTATTLCWGILLMMKYPEIQKKVQEEIHAQIKEGQMPTFDDRRNMPYTEAVIHEIQRIANVFPFNVPRTTPRDVFFRGYCIPKGTEVIPFLTSVLYDKTQWESPYEFNPNHFLDEAGKFVKRDAFMPFSAACIVFLYWINGSKKSKKKMPPGPKPLPFIGNLNVLDLRKPNESLMELSEKYGEIFTIYLGPKKIVVITGCSAVKDALVNQADDFGERAHIPVFKLISKGKGITFTNGEIWKVMRRFTVSTLREFGMGKKTIEARIQDELIPLIEGLKSYNGKPFDATHIINSAMSNVICSIIFGERFDYNNHIFKKIVQAMYEIGKLTGSSKLLMFHIFPRLATLLETFRKIVWKINEVKEFVLGRIKHQRQELNSNAISGYIDTYLMKQEQELAKAKTFFDDENLVSTVVDLFSAGTVTTATTLCWGILLMMKYPEIQKKVQEEIHTQIKQGQMPTFDDRRNMPYTEAVVHEIQRFANVFPFNVPRTTPRDVFFRGYCIPKGTVVIPFLTSVLYDKTQWETPYEFNPNHFLGEAEKFVKRDAFMPFSAGRRACVGESLAKMELFLFFTGLLQTFTFHPPPGVSREDISLSPHTALVLFPMPQLICAKFNN